MTKEQIRMTNNELEARVIELETKLACKEREADSLSLDLGETITDRVSLGKIKFRHVPVPFTQESWSGRGEGELQRHCSRANEGHVLRIIDDRIECIKCKAQWKDYGY